MNLFQYTVPLIKQARWRMFEQFLILYQVIPNSPYFVVRPSYNGGAKVMEPRNPDPLTWALSTEQALTGAGEWLKRNDRSQYRCSWSYVMNQNANLTAEARKKASKTVHITKLHESLAWPKSIGMIFPDSLPIIAHQTKKLWVPDHIKNADRILPGTWAYYEFPGYIEYVRLK